LHRCIQFVLQKLFHQLLLNFQYLQRPS
jgi:hypothetical protein